MLLIHCPYCDQDRPELEFAYAGEAGIALAVEGEADRAGVVDAAAVREAVAGHFASPVRLATSGRGAPAL